LMIRSRASSLCRLAKVRGLSGAGRFGSAPAPAAGPGVCPPSPTLVPAPAAPCAGFWAGGEAWDWAGTGAPAGTGGAEEFLGILARAGAASGTSGGGIVGELSW
jgi:hypothetical protein